MKLCKNCKHFRAPAGGLDAGEYSKCWYGRTANPVTGALTFKSQSLEYCITLRQSQVATDCGPDARFFECGNFLNEGDDDNVALCGDEGRLCETCGAAAAREHEWMRGKSKGACTGVMSDEDKQDLRDAGRGHLVGP